MKSIMEEASSIVKAIEKGWVKAGQPKEFSVKIFEEPQKNFIGMTTKSAKIGIFFNDAVVKGPAEPIVSRYKQQAATGQATPQFSKQRNYAQTEQPRISKESIKQESPKSAQPKNIARPAENQKEPQERELNRDSVWSAEMIESCAKHVKKTLSLMGLSSVNVKLDPQYFHLKIYFDGEIIADQGRQKQFFSSLSTLLLQMLKHEFRRPLKGYKIILIGAQ